MILNCCGRQKIQWPYCKSAANIYNWQEFQYWLFSSNFIFFKILLQGANNMAYYKTWPGPFGLAWPQSWPGLNFGLYFGLNSNFGLASKIGLASNLASKFFFCLIFFFRIVIYWLWFQYPSFIYNHFCICLLASM